MPKLANRRHEIFAVELAAGTPLLESYLRAGYRDTYSARFNASRLRNTPKIAMRIMELLDDFKERTFCKIEYVQRELVKIVEGRADSSVKVDADGNQVRERDRLGALDKLARTLGGYATQVDVTHGVGDGLNVLFAALSADDQRVLADALEGLVKSEQPAAALPAPLVTPRNESAPAQRVTPDNRNSQHQPAPTAPPAPEPPRLGRRRFLQLAQLRAGAARPLSPEFTGLRSDIQGALVRFVSPSLRDSDLSTWPASPGEIREVLALLAPIEVAELLNMMAGQSPTMQGFDAAP